MALFLGVPGECVCGTPPIHRKEHCLTSFAELGLDQRTVETLRRMDVVDPTPIQEAALPELLAGRDVVGQARTGSGKTLAFALPIMAACDPNLSEPQALILVPTRELAGQVGRVIDQLGPIRGLRAAQIYGGRDMAAQLDLLNSGPQIIIGTPGRTLDHLYRGALRLRHLRLLILDEADQMLDAGFGPDVDLIFDCSPGGIQVALFSATIPKWVNDVISHRLHDPVQVHVDEAQRGPNASVEHTIVEVPQPQKLNALCSLLDERGDGNVVVFCRTKIGVERLERQLNGAGIRVAALQGNLSQPVRERVMRGFRRGNPPILVATNVAARGLDVLSIEMVINFDVPDSAELLTHRLGRTGRMGRHGAAVTLLSPAEIRAWQVIEHQIGVRVKREMWDGHAIREKEESSPLPSPATASSAASVQPTAPGGETGARNRRSSKPRHDAVCAQCGQATKVSFVPKADRPVYCSTCFRERKGASAA
jgi:ATP-dependent RNA helicase DeaD